MVGNQHLSVSLQDCLHNKFADRQWRISNILLSHSGQTIAVVLNSSVIEVYSDTDTANMVFIRSFEFDEIRAIAWISSKELAISASSPANLWVNEICLQSRIWIDHLFCDGEVLVGAGLKGSNAKPFVWAWNPVDHQLLWSCQLSSDSGRPCFVARIQVDGAAIIGLDTGSFHLVRDGIEVFQVSLAIHIRHASLVELTSPGSIPAVFVVSATNDLKFVSLEDFSSVEIPLSGTALVESEGDLVGISTSDGLFSVYSITSLTEGPVFMIPFAKPSISTHFRLSKGRFAIAFEECMKIYNCNITSIPSKT